MISKKTPMLFEGLEIKKENWGANKGKFVGRARFSSKNADVTINVTPEMIEKILELCAESLMETAHEMSEVMKGDIIEALPIEKKLKIK